MGDNGVALSGVVTESPQQTQALEYFDYIVEKNGYDKKNIEITVTGHSKGGNKAQYITINSKYRDLIKYCFSCDGQAFCPEVIKAFKERFDDYDESVKKLYSFNGSNDFVNPLGIYIIPDENRFYFETVIPSKISLNIDSYKDFSKVLDIIKKDRKSLSEFKKLHFPDSCLTEEGTFSKQTEQGFISLLVENVSQEVMILDPEEREKIFRAVMSLFQGDNETVDGEIVASWSDKMATLESREFLLGALKRALLDTVKEKEGIVDQVVVFSILTKIYLILMFGDVIATGGVKIVKISQASVEFFRDITTIAKRTALDILENLKNISIVTENFKNEMLNSLKILGKTVLVESVEFIKKLFYPRQSGMETGEFLLAYGGALGVAFYKFILEARDSFGRLVKHIGVIIDDMIKISKSALKDTAEKMLIYSKRIIAAVTGFFNNLASGINNFLIYRKKAGFNLLHSTVEIVIEGINNAKEIIKKGREKLKEGVNRVVNYLDNIAKAVTVNLVKKAVVECIRGLKFLVDKIKESVLGIKGLEVSLTEVFLKFMSEAEKALVRLKDYVLGIANNIKDAVHTGIKAMEDFKDRIEKAISNFILSISNGIKNFAKYCKKEVANAWNKVTRKASQTVEKVCRGYKTANKNYA